MNILKLICLSASIAAIPLASSAADESMLQCIKGKVDSASAPKPMKVVIDDQGCTSSGTGSKWDALYVYHDCEATICWDASQNEVIADAKVEGGSISGSAHSFSPPIYQIAVPGGYMRVCSNVFARSGDEHGVRGWQKVKISVSLKGTVTPEAMMSFVGECADAAK